MILPRTLWDLPHNLAAIEIDGVTFLVTPDKLIMSEYSYRIDPRRAELGGGWRLRLLEGGEEVGGGIFPPDEGIEDAEAALSNSYADALDEGEVWLSSKTENRAALQGAETPHSA